MVPVTHLTPETRAFLMAEARRMRERREQRRAAEAAWLASLSSQQRHHVEPFEARKRANARAAS